MDKTGYRGSMVKDRWNPANVAALRLEVPHIFYYACTGMVIALWVVSAIRIPTPAFSFDDSYIALHSAEVLRSGKDMNYVGTPALSGVTSVAHVTLVSALLSIFRPLRALQASQWLAVLAYALGLARLAFVNGANWIQASLLVFAGILVGNGPHHLFNGLETGLALAGLTWALAIASDANLRLARWVPVFYAQLPFVRPEMALVVILLLGLRFWERRRQTPDVRYQLRAAARDMALLILGATPWIMAYLASTGSPYPNTIQAKQNFFAQSCWPLVTKCAHALGHLKSLTATFGLLSLAAVFMFLTSIGRLGVFFCSALVVVYVIKFPGAIGHYQHRYMHIMVPFLLCGLATTFLHRVRQFRIAGTVLLALIAVQATWALPACWKMHRVCNNFAVTELEGVASWTRMNLPPNATLMVHDAGYISFATKFRLFDLVGLKTPAMLPFHRITAATCGLGRVDAVNRFARFVHPDYIVILDEWDELFRFTEVLRILGWQLEPMRPRTASGKWPRYQVYRMTLLDATNSERMH